MTAVRPDPGALRAWADAYGLPVNYTSIDIETTGLDVDRDYVLQIGWCRVADRNAVENAGVAVNCVAGMAPAECDVVRSRLAGTAAHMAADGHQYEWSVDRVKTGLPPREAAERLAAACDASHVLSHYGTFFDYLVVDRFCQRYISQGLPNLETGRLLDTYLMYKAAVAPLYPRRGESYAAFVRRVRAARVGPKCSMAACVDALGLARRGAVIRRAHDAVYDAWLAHLVYERLRDVAGGSAW